MLLLVFLTGDLANIVEKWGRDRENNVKLLLLAQ